MLVFVFFARRRRHTRCLSDWSSDVCSSDLLAGELSPKATEGGRHDAVSAPGHGGARRRRSDPSPTRKDDLRRTRRSTPPSRSEERRVGNECRSRWASYESQKK